MAPRHSVTSFCALVLAAFVTPLVSAQGGRAGGASVVQPPPSVSNTPLQPGTGAISGVVFDGTTGAAVGGAVVTLNIPGRPIAPVQSRQISDAKGRFAFVNLPAAPGYTMAASKFGYLDGGHGRDASPTDALRPLNLRDAEWIPNVRVTVWRPGAISGTVIDERGDPVVGVWVRVLARFRLFGRDELAAGPMVLTDDRGAYRIAGLSPGKYIVQVPSVQASMPSAVPYVSRVIGSSTVDALLELAPETRLVVNRFPLPPPPVNGRALAYPIAFYPGSPAVAQATTIDLAFGQDRTGVDITLEPVPTARVSGTVVGPAEAMNALTLRLLPAGLENLGQGAEIATALVAADGRFTFLNVPAGTYTVDAPRTFNEFTLTTGRGGSGQVFPPPPSNRGGWSRNTTNVDAVPGVSFSTGDFRGGAANFSGRTTVTVSGADVMNLVVTVRPNITISGRIIVELDPGQPVPPATQRYLMTLDPVAGSAALGMPRSTLQPDRPVNEFTIPGVQPGEYWLRLASGGFLIKSVQWRDRDYTDVPLDVSASPDVSGLIVTVTNAVPVLTGGVRGRNNAPATSATVLAFPVNRDLWVNTGFSPARLKAAAVSGDGTYRFNTLPAGDYLVVAVSGPAPNAWRDPELLAAAERLAVRVTLRWGGQASQDLTVSAVR